ncbi:hypothetical protein [Fundidesulfovibrio terrae]|uniref:hypothetical protein n=1 Tax=Fundidesulfovibrio terrae TaxID=2922866 RepID=UPI001FAECA63|nr:hypothetical protein [Fundidesulfovibrio terrae]
MSYDVSDWIGRLSSRSDLTHSIFHLTRPAGDKSAVDVLIKILCEKTIIASKPAEAFIIGDRGAACFQNIPLYSICQNLKFEREYKERKGYDKTRYTGVGLGFQVNYAFALGCRPVIYEDKNVAKNILPPEEHWRVVHYSPNTTTPVDWSHEREWRFPGNFVFARKTAHVILESAENYKEFIEKSTPLKDIDLVNEVRSITCLEALFY